MEVVATGTGVPIPSDGWTVTATYVAGNPAAPTSALGVVPPAQALQQPLAPSAPPDVSIENLEKRADVRLPRHPASVNAFIEHFLPRDARVAIDTSFSRLGVAVQTTAASVQTGFARAATILPPPLASVGRSVLANAAETLHAIQKNHIDLAAANRETVDNALYPITLVGQWVRTGVEVAVTSINGQYQLPLTISNVQVVKLSPTAATVSWDTSRPAIGKVNYGASTSYGEETLINVYTLHHSAALANLAPGQKTYFEILATDVENVTTFDAFYSFMTPIRAAAK